MKKRSTQTHDHTIACCALSSRLINFAYEFSGEYAIRSLLTTALILFAFVPIPFHSFIRPLQEYLVVNIHIFEYIWPINGSFKCFNAEQWSEENMKVDLQLQIGENTEIDNQNKEQ